MVRWNEQLITIVLPVIPTKQDRPDVNYNTFELSIIYNH